MAKIQEGREMGEPNEGPIGAKEGPAEAKERAYRNQRKGLQEPKEGPAEILQCDHLLAFVS